MQASKPFRNPVTPLPPGTRRPSAPSTSRKSRMQVDDDSTSIVSQSSPESSPEPEPIPPRQPVASTSRRTLYGTDQVSSDQRGIDDITAQLGKRRLNSIGEQDVGTEDSQSTTVSQAFNRMKQTASTVALPFQSAPLDTDSQRSAGTPRMVRNKTVTNLLGLPNLNTSSPDAGSLATVKTRKSLQKQVVSKVQKVIQPFQKIVKSGKATTSTSAGDVFISQLYPGKRALDDGDGEQEDTQEWQFVGKSRREIKEIIRNNYDPTFLGPQPYWRSAARSLTYYKDHSLALPAHMPGGFVEYLLALDLALHADKKPWWHSLLVPLAEIACDLVGKPSSEQTFTTRELIEKADLSLPPGRSNLFQSRIMLPRVIEGALSGGPDSPGVKLSGIVVVVSESSPKTYRLTANAPLLISFQLRSLLQGYEKRAEAAPKCEPQFWRLENLYTVCRF
ncbi:hypothetical protein JCM3765_007766 [Sporobolomyces pararoseus]